MTEFPQSHAVSVIIPYFNASEWISAAVSSLITGNKDSIAEIVVVNDGSDPQHLPALNELTKNYSALRVVHLAQNLGGAAARNQAVNEATSKWIFCLDADNLAPPGLIKALHNHALTRKLDVCTPEFSLFFSQDPARPTHVWQYRETPITLRDHFSCPYVPSASGNYLFSRESFDRAGGYPSFSRSLDTWGFGLRQVATGSKMSCAKGSYYLHRYGHNSYWVRESKKSNLSLTATSIALPFAAEFPRGLLKKMLGRHRLDWFERINKHPLISQVGPPAGRLLPENEGQALMDAVLTSTSTQASNN